MALKFLNNGYFAGKVGIGIESPTTQLHLKRTSGDVRGVMVETTVTTSYAEVQLKADREFRIGTGGSGSGANAAGVFYVYDATVGGAAGHRFEISSAGDVQARRVRSNTAGEVALSLQPTDSTIHYGFRIDQTTNSFNFDRVDSADNLMSISADGQLRIQNLESWSAGNNTEVIGHSALEIGPVRAGTNNSLCVVPVAGNLAAVQAIDRSSNNVQNLPLNPFGGNVGIGTTSPQHLLHLKSTISGPTGIIIENTNNAQSLDLDFWNNAGAAQARIRYNEGAGSFDFLPNVGAGTAMTMLYGGNVGIGTTTPFEKLQTNGNIYAENRIISADATNANQNLLTQADIKISNQTDIYGNLTKVIISPYEAAYTSDGTGSSTIRLDSETAMTPGAIHTFSVYYKDLVGSLNIDLYDVGPSGSYTTATGTASAPASGRLYGYAQKASTGAGANYNFVDINLTNNGSVTLLNPKLETGKVVTEFIATTEAEGIPQTITTNNLRATGSIQMGADDTTATADKVGTMRYRTGTEYVEVDGVELVTNGNFDSATGWNLNSNWSISGGTCNADGTSNNDINQNQNVGVVGQKYRITYVISAYTQGSISARIGSGVTAYNTGTGTFTEVVTATTTDRIRMNITSSFIGSVDSLSIVKVTAEDASYADMCMQTALTTYEWVNIVRNTY